MNSALHTDSAYGSYTSADTLNNPNVPQPHEHRTIVAPANAEGIYVLDDGEIQQGYHYGVPQEQQQQWANIVFEDKSRRMLFVRKVLGTVGLQLLFCFGVGAACIYGGKPVRDWMIEYYWVGFVSAIGWITIDIAVTCCGVGRGPPNLKNAALLCLATIFLSAFAAFITVRYDVEVFIWALGSTMFIVVCLMFITMCTKIDITGCGIFLVCFTLGVMVASLMASLVFAFGHGDRGSARITLIVMSALFVVLFSLYILYELQLLLGGRKHRINEDDWLFACLVLFGDIVVLFLELLRLIGLSRSNSY